MNIGSQGTYVASVYIRQVLLCQSSHVVSRWHVDGTSSWCLLSGVSSATQ